MINKLKELFLKKEKKKGSINSDTEIEDKDINYFNDIVYSKPKLSITLTATLAQLLGYWN